MANQIGSGQSGQQSAKQKMITGSAWMTAGSITSRILGAIYIIPWVTWFGIYSNQANAAYAQGYNIYNMFITIATAGIPSAISKMVAHYNGLNQANMSRKLYRAGITVAIVSGIICAAIMMVGAPLFAKGDKTVTPVIRSLSWAILVIPWMSITRGYLQGYSWMAPSAMSQFVEQLFRVIYMLSATYLIMKLGSGNWVHAVTQSTFAAFIGAIGSVAVLGWSYLRHLGEMKEMSDRAEPLTQDVSAFRLILDIVYQAIPFIIIESGITIFQLVDQYTFDPMMKAVGHFTHYQLDVLYALFSFNANKLYMIVISLAAAMAVTAIPLLAEARVQDDQQEMRDQISNILMLFYFVMIPASLGLSALAQPIYTVFYRYDPAGVTMLKFTAYISITLGLYTVAAAMMQGISENMRMMKFLVIGLVIKLVIQFPLIWLFKGVGPLLATGLSMTVINYLILHSFNEEFRLPFHQMAKDTNQILLFSLIMYAVTAALVMVVNLFTSPYGRFAAALTMVVGVILGGGIYAYLSLRSRLADRLLGPRVGVLREKLHIR
ncbi:MAG: polysaccharide biosynthesis protein [[Lactobacillus] timonensis]|jgi:O-antigen/teichoic acid export membrane protein|uniref:putative polysaccharide biosynthesis protein n=1 Tax=[Lactobacillus] timonensis TaxID=1970790 RepID=UPI002355720E|nr:polysaccharide biosynthesis protein [[Lactobacillus] timonensis]MCI1926402.1 polysaccharide biosynthesis protein [[Lactobacillus] timonensis]MCI1957759.1 polysaccharide biosynthesis protein [[Lactobacillus] timonensis]MCI1970781.1 polysaccharide biosynthesis protein [[Lactobacillus] timonensis]MCI2006927.1 polysaccharide biosynthesis protein [[Lactobacillus] timonensis]